MYPPNLPATGWIEVEGARAAWRGVVDTVVYKVSVCPGPAGEDLADGLARLRDVQARLEVLPPEQFAVIVEVYACNGQPAVVTRWYEGQDLQALRSDPALDVTRTATLLRLVGIAIQTVERVQRIEALGLTWLDPKLPNFTLGLDGTVVAIDLVTATEAGELVTPCGTPGMAAPEVVSGWTSATSDRPALGISLFQLFTGQDPPGFVGEPGGALVAAAPVIDREDVARWNEAFDDVGAPRFVADAVRGLLRDDPKDRGDLLGLVDAMASWRDKLERELEERERERTVDVPTRPQRRLPRWLPWVGIGLPLAAAAALAVAQLDDSPVHRPPVDRDEAVLAALAVSVNGDDPGGDTDAEYDVGNRSRVGPPPGDEPPGEKPPGPAEPTKPKPARPGGSGASSPARGYAGSIADVERACGHAGAVDLATAPRGVGSWVFRGPDGRWRVRYRVDGFERVQLVERDLVDDTYFACGRSS